jgi:uroporphyrin-III C-methyltransferase / precorrin-2 dehydrogenase / sirohydrochlorin ferrochelatase
MTQRSRKPSKAAPPRMQPLAKLPVFFDLAGKRVAVVGGTDASAWKAELLAAAGADVEVYASHLHPEMSALLQRGTAAGSLVHQGPVCGANQLAGAALLVADAENDTQAAAFVAMARAAGLPVNVIDRPTYCDFQFGSIVNRSPIVIGISTDGAAPILGQEIRRRIETLLPPGLAAWASMAKQLRKAVAAKLQPGTARRSFWERFSTAAFTQNPPTNANQLLSEIAAFTPSTQGRVTLVGAGPGDAEYLTLKAVRALQSADVILFDDLVADDVLELARREAKRMLVGKRGHRESCHQEDINDLMVKLAHQGKHVVRLKSGDPMIFGRAGEEITRLEAEGIPVSVVPGITAASAMAARLGISLTHRDHAQSVRFVTGHSRHGRLPEDLDWQGSADPRTTTIVYMGGKTAADLASRLINAGLPTQTPIVVVRNVARSNETVRHGDLGDLAQLADRTGHDGPILIGIGRVFEAKVVGSWVMEEWALAQTL